MNDEGLARCGGFLTKGQLARRLNASERKTAFTSLAARQNRAAASESECESGSRRWEALVPVVGTKEEKQAGSRKALCCVGCWQGEHSAPAMARARARELVD